MHRCLQAAVLGFLLLAFTAAPLRADTTPSPPTDPRVDELLRRIEELERTVASQQETIRKLQALSAGASTEVAPPAPPGETPPELEQQLAKELGQTAQQPSPEPAAPSAPAPITIASGAGGKSYLNLSLDALLAAGTSSEPDVRTLQPGGHDPIQRGFTVQNVEAVLEGAVDPYFKGQANIVLQIDEAGETTVELEEVYGTSTSLPHNLQVKVGQFFTEFGRLNSQHPHSWDFVDQPLVNGRIFGPDGLRSVGARLSWLMPAPFYSELLVTLQNAAGETLTSFGSVPGETVFGRPIEEQVVRSWSDLLVAPRYSASFDLSDTQTLLIGGSAALGPNGTGAGADTRIYGLDAFWKWKPPTANRGFPFVKIQAEAMARHYEAAASPSLVATTFEDQGGYAQAVWGFHPGWVVAMRYDRVGGDAGEDPTDPVFESRRRASANVTWFPTEFSKLRLQYNHDQRELQKDADSLWLQFEFLLGAHAAHKF